MRRSLLSVVVLCLLAAAVPAAQAAPEAMGPYIVVLEDSVGDPSAVAASHARDHGASISHVYTHALKGYSASMSDTAARRITGDGRVRLVQADRAVHATDVVSPSVPTGVHRSYAAHNSSIDIDDVDDSRVDVDVAIIDSGIDTDHPDLNVVGGKNCSTGSSYDDGNGHGSHVAGTVAGLDNGAGAVGMAPGARLLAVRVLDNSASGSWSNVICGIDWVTGFNTNKNADGTLKTSDDIEVANMSLGGSGSEPSDPDFDCVTSSSLHDAVCRSVTSGVTYAVAAGNSSADAAGHVPASYNEVMTVSALADFNGEPGGGAAATCRSDVDDTFANFSNYGPDVDVIAPGVCIRSTWKGGGYNTISGTSMASPHVAGAAALYKSSHPTASPGAVQDAIVSSGNLAWTWPSEDKDTIQEALLDVGSTADKSSLFAPTFVGAAPPPSPAAPVANDDSATTTKATAVTVAVLANDADANGDPLTVANLTAASNGSTTLNADHTVTYVPGSDFVGTDTFTYQANDGSALSNVATVTVTVTDPTLSPALTVAVAKEGSTTKQGGWYRANLKVSVTDGSAPVAGASVVLEVRSDSCPGGSSHGTVSGTSGSDGTVTFSFKSRKSGSYCALASATMDGYTKGEASSSFTL